MATITNNVSFGSTCDICNAPGKKTELQIASSELKLKMKATFVVGVCATCLTTPDQVVQTLIARLEQHEASKH